MSAPAIDDPEVVNEVRIVGRVSAAASEKVLPSGDRLSSFRVVVPRAAAARRKSRQSVDSIECVAWSARSRRAAGSWRVGDVVEVTGSLRRRFFQTGGGAASRCEIEVSSGRVIRRAAT